MKRHWKRRRLKHGSKLCTTRGGRDRKKVFIESYHSSWLQSNRLGARAQTAKRAVPCRLEPSDLLAIVITRIHFFDGPILFFTLSTLPPPSPQPWVSRGEQGKPAECAYIPWLPADEGDVPVTSFGREARRQCTIVRD
jgi:hypothetical protein